MSLLKSEKGEKSTYTLEFTVGKEAFVKACADAYAKNAKQFNVPGFRKGKAPRSVVEKMYGKAVFYDDALNAVLPDVFEEALKESGLDMVGQPEFDVVSLNDGEDVVMKAVIAVKPECVVEGYIGLEVENEVPATTEAEIDAELKTIQERNAREIEITDETPAVMGDVATIDYAGTVDGVAFDNGTSTEPYPLKLGSGNFIPGFEEQVAGHKIGEEFDVKVTFPADYNAKELAGKEANFHCKLHKLTHVELPELDDEFAKDVSSFDTFAEYKKDVKAKITTRHETEAQNALEDKLMEAVLEKTTVEIPEQMLAAEVENFVRDYDMRLRSSGLDLKTYFKYTGQTLEQLREQMKPNAEKQIRSRLALEFIAAENPNDTAVTDEEVTAEIERIATENGMKAEDVLKYVTKEAITTDLKVKKALDFVKDKANVKKPKKACKPRAKKEKEIEK